jgi:hypothetical protein
MAAARFLSNDTLWREIRGRIAAARSVSMAVAYMGKGAAKLLPLRSGHRLVVDMSLGAVRQGVTDPREVRKLMGRGVQVFSRATLHAKFLVADKVVIAGSANASRNSQNILDEAAVLTGDPAAVARALDFFSQLCTEPVRDEYLKLCLREYRPPKFKAAVEPKKRSRRRRAAVARVWFVGGLVLLEPKEADAKSLAAVEAKAKKSLARPRGSDATWIRYRKRPGFFGRVRDGDWIIRSMAEQRGGDKFVYPPAQVIGSEPWRSALGTTYHLMLLEVPSRGEAMTWAQFCRRSKWTLPGLGRGAARTRPVADEEAADELLRLWTPAGRVARQRKPAAK